MLKAFNSIDGIANKYTVLPTVYQHLKNNSDKWVEIVSFFQGHLLVVKYVSTQKFKLSLNIIFTSLCLWVIVFYYSAILWKANSWIFYLNNGTQFNFHCTSKQNFLSWGNNRKIYIFFLWQHKSFFGCFMNF